MTDTPNNPDAEPNTGASEPQDSNASEKTVHIPAWRPEPVAAPDPGEATTVLPKAPPTGAVPTAPPTGAEPTAIHQTPPPGGPAPTAIHHTPPPGAAAPVGIPQDPPPAGATAIHQVVPPIPSPPTTSTGAFSGTTPPSFEPTGADVGGPRAGGTAPPFEPTGSTGGYQPPTGSYGTEGLSQPAPQYYQTGQYTGVGQPDASPATGETAAVDQPAGKKKKPLLLLAGLAVVALAALLITGFIAPGFLKVHKLDVNSVQEGVKQVLTDSSTGYGATNVTEVKCNNGGNPTIKKGSSFDCDVTVNGAKHKVKVTFGDDTGTYWVGGPT